MSVEGLRFISAAEYVPEHILTNDDIQVHLNQEICPDWVKGKLGISERRIITSGESTSSLAEKAVRKAIQNAGVRPESIDLLILATASPERRAPATACIVQFDVSAVCSGFLFALSIATAMMNAGAARRAIVVGADTFSDATDWERRDCVFFGDGAGAVLLEKRSIHIGGGNAGRYDSELFTNGRDLEAFTIPLGSSSTFLMDGKAVFDAAAHAVPKCIDAVLTRNAITADDIDIVIPHQPSRYLLENIAASSGISFDRFELCMGRVANTVGATIPIALAQAMENNRISTGDAVLFATAGAGFTAGAALHFWS
ncbi:3-oxoacyl-ACP synthase III family protein [Phyllobacterium leguminum]|uniref:3-oxoacyl-[acyl-carrier-protein] synthase-3 n=1 Tax=Phyllobacterium leguminum TaxID=314237 RepID=A0A318SZC9_9HYPH|nr:ketoacyl-ACP synthase III [Phyllobacterium leguminum]PYE85127.1 3-oxoacyl-[acyl-carrier-protein] synthase-3 [Phyllobacterium leguminum]